MCGLAGSVDFPLHFERMRAALQHRGPDDQTIFQADNVQLFHARLSIVDKAGGVQPMHHRNRYSIVFNGEIYNHNELRKQHNLNGQTHSDTETILLLFERFGTDCLQELDGMFVFAIYDEQEKSLFIARDRAGKKPLYLFNDGKKILFASELNALRSQLKLELNKDNFYHYLRLGVFYRELTPYQQVTEMPAGSWMKIHCRNREIQSERWWNVHDYYRKPQTYSFEEALTETNTRLQQSVRRRLESSDLEVGAFLSGGIDSGLVTAIASQLHPKIKTFTVSFEGAYDEAPLAKLVADRYQTDHTEIRISFRNLQNDIEKILCNYGEPFFDSSAIPSYYVSQEAKKYLTVILNGDGADELFGGYRRYVPFARYDFFQSNGLIRSGASLLNKLLPAAHDKKSTFNFITRLTGLASKKDLEVYLSAGLDIIEGFENNIRSAEDYLLPLRNDFRRLNRSGLSGLKKIMNMDFDTNLFSDLLVKMDIATMAHSLEGRSPFLGKELLEFAPGLPDAYKIKGGQTKVLLRALAKQYLPESLIHQPKRGFEVPLKSWVNNELKPMIQDYLTASGTLHRELIDHSFLQQLLADKINISAEKRAKIIWTIFCMEVWYRNLYRNQV